MERSTVINRHSRPIIYGAGDSLDARVEAATSEVFEEVKATAREFNTRGDLLAGTNISSFLKVANVMLSHGSV